MMTFTELASVLSDPLAPFTDRLRLEVAAYLMQQALLAGLCLQVVVPLAGELAADAGGVRTWPSPVGSRVWPGDPAVG